MITDHQIPDKEWLERILIAYRVYPQQSEEIKNFISWLYRQYGIVQPKDLTYNENKNAAGITNNSTQKISRL